jgi:hypothetical protein
MPKPRQSGVKRLRSRKPKGRVRARSLQRLAPTPTTDGFILALESHIPVGGRLTQFHRFWGEYCSDQWVTELISLGYAIEFSSMPHTTPRIRETHVGSSQIPILEMEISTSLLKRAIEPVPTRDQEEGFYSTFFLVPKKLGI